jgi:hypothetical protein
MNALTQTWRQLVRRRLWPVALLLVAALVAVPVVLAKPAADPAAPADATAAAAVATPAQSYVHLASDDATTQTPKRRRVLGATKDPFEPAPLPKPKKTHKKKAAKATATATPAATATSTPAASGGGTSGASGGGTTVAPVTTPAPAAKPTAPANSVEVRFGKTDGATTAHTLTRLKTLPNASSPLAVFMGFAKAGKAAVFMLTGNVTAEGDGTCDPSPQSCETLLLREGQTEFLTVTGTKADGEYELDVKDIHATKSASASAAALVAKATPTATATPMATAVPTP